MSYILDALKKSERERSGTRAVDLPDDNTNDARRNPWPLVVGLVLLSNAALGIGWWTWQHFVRSENSVATTPLGEPSATTGSPAPVPVPLSPSATPAQPVAPAAKISAGDLSAEAQRRAPPLAAPAPLTAKVKLAAPTPISTLPEFASTRPVATQPAAESAPWLRELPDGFRQSVAPLNVNIHVYAGTDADSVLYINDRQYRAGEQLPNGVRLEAVVADGAILSYQGQRFKLPRPN